MRDRGDFMSTIGMRLLAPAAVASALLAGCASGRIDSGWPFPVEAAAAVRITNSDGTDGKPLRQMQPDLTTLIVDELSRHGFPYPAKPDKTEGIVDRQVWFPRLIAAVDASNSKSVRNGIVSTYIAASTANCTVYVQALRSGQVSTRLTTDVLAGALATASSIATPQSSAQLLAALSGFSIATGSTMDRNIFAQQGAEIVADAILTLRAETRLGIEASMKKSYAEWPLGLALADLHNYQGDCSMLRGFSRMRDAVNAREQTIQALRNAAAAVVRNDGSARQVMSVFEAYGPSAPYATLSSVTVLPVTDWRADLEILIVRTHDCLKASAKTIGDEKAKADALDNAASAAIGAGADFPTGWCTAATGPLEPAYRKLAMDGLRAAELDDADNLDETYKTILESYRDAANAHAARTVSLREVAAIRLENWSGGVAADVIATLKTIGGGVDYTATPPPADADPVFVYASRAAENVRQVSPTDGPQAAAMALAAAKAVVERAR
jgi:hypothetical protein